MDCESVGSNGPTGLTHGLEDPPAALTLNFRPGTASLDFMHPLMKKLVKRRIETCQTQAGVEQLARAAPLQRIFFINKHRTAPMSYPHPMATHLNPEGRRKQRWLTMHLVDPTLKERSILSTTTEHAFCPGWERPFVPVSQQRSPRWDKRVLLLSRVRQLGQMRAFGPGW